MKRAWVLAALFCLLPAVVYAQTTGLVRGRVLDAESRVPVRGAFVAQSTSERGTLTDSLGMFALSMERSLEPTIRIWQLGYRGIQTGVPANHAGRVLTVMLAPDPVQIEGLTVLTERLANRRRGPYGIGDIMVRDQLLSTSAGTGFDLVRSMMPFLQPCDRESEALCMGGRLGMNGARQVTVCVDGHKVSQEVMETILSGVDPRTLYMVEAYTRVGEVRMYSAGYMTRLLEQGLDLPPLTFGCQDGGSLPDPGSAAAPLVP